MNILLILKKMWANKSLILLIGIVILGLLICGQKRTINTLENQLNEVTNIAEQNLAALSDNEVQLQVTRDQLKVVNIGLYESLLKIENLLKIKPKEIIKTEIRYIPRDIIVPSTLIIDSTNKYFILQDSNYNLIRTAPFNPPSIPRTNIPNNGNEWELMFGNLLGDKSTNYGLNFKSVDVVRTIEGTSWFTLKENNLGYEVIPKPTIIHNFDLNFALVISKYEDNITNITKIKITPFNVKSDGTLGDSIPQSMLKLSYRNAELLEKPFQNNPSSVLINVPTKSRFLHGIGLSINPLALGIYSGGDGTVRYGWTPNISLGYFITYTKK